MAGSSSKEAFHVVIDGPAGAGKSSVARRLARRLGLPLLDSGAIYRSLALIAQRRGVNWDDEDGLVSLAQTLPLTFAESAAGDDAPQRVLLGEEDVTETIRNALMTEGASKVSAHPKVRAALLDLQRQLARKGCVAEGRDMGTVVFPDARYKFFVTADLETRASRRLADFEAGGSATSLEVVKRDLEERDQRDQERNVAPLAQAEDAECIDTSALSLDEAVQVIYDRVRSSAAGG